MKRYIMVSGRIAVALVALIALLGAACSSDDSSSGSKGSSTSGSSASGSTQAATTDAGGAITIVAKDNVFQPKEFAAKANQPVKLTLDNQGAAVHDLQVAKQNGPDGQELHTPLLPGGQKGSVEFQLPAGNYEFYCAVHPVEMRGKLKVE